MQLKTDRLVVEVPGPDQVLAGRVTIERDRDEWQVTVEDAAALRGRAQPVTLPIIIRESAPLSNHPAGQATYLARALRRWWAARRRLPKEGLVRLSGL